MQSVEEECQISRIVEIDPNLEELQNNPERGANVDLIVIDLKRHTSNVHAGYLFMHVATNILQTICLWVGEASLQTACSNWKELGNLLGVSDKQRRNIENDYKEKEGPVWWVLATHAQNDDATLAEVIHALENMKRPDIINKISNDVFELVRHIFKHVSLGDTRQNKSEILRPPTIPWVPLVLRPPISTIEKVYSFVNLTMIIPNPAEQDDNTITDITENKISFAMRIMLTFANDGIEAAERIARKFRSHRTESGGRIGVLILKEQLEHVFVDGEQFVRDCLCQVDAIVPILTNGYIKVINGHHRSEEPLSLLEADEKYAQYIYKCLTDEYVNNHCRSKRVRSFVPDDVKINHFNINPSLKPWLREAVIQSMIPLLLSEYSKKYLKKRIF